jgi:hypothetical protein
MSNAETTKILVLNGQYYAGKNEKHNALVFAKKRAEAVKIENVSELHVILETVFGWVIDGEIELKRIEVLMA